MDKDGSAELIWSGGSRKKTDGDSAGVVTGVKLGGLGDDDGRVEAFGIDATVIKDEAPKNYRKVGRFKVTVER